MVEYVPLPIKSAFLPYVLIGVLSPSPRTASERRSCPSNQTPSSRRPRPSLSCPAPSLPSQPNSPTFPRSFSLSRLNSSSSSSRSNNSNNRLNLLNESKRRPQERRPRSCPFRLRRRASRLRYRRSRWVLEVRTQSLFNRPTPPILLSPFLSSHSSSNSSSSSSSNLNSCSLPPTCPLHPPLLSRRSSPSLPTLHRPPVLRIHTHNNARNSMADITRPLRARI
jgi:hypothetical protein